MGWLGQTHTNPGRSDSAIVWLLAPNVCARTGTARSCCGGGIAVLQRHAGRQVEQRGLHGQAKKGADAGSKCLLACPALGHLRAHPNRQAARSKQ